MTIVAFGVTGDLMRLKIVPALHALYAAGSLPVGTRVIGISRRPWDNAQLHAYLQEMLPQAEESFLSLFTFLQGDAENIATFETLKRELGEDDALIYLSLAPTLYGAIFANMQQAGLGKRPGTIRLMLEKPFGISGASAEELYLQLQDTVAEKDLYLVDHYLAKDWVRELGALPVVRENIAQVDIRFLERVGVEQRGALYDQLGTLHDVVQNHLLQILAHLVAPSARTEALEQLEPFSPAEVATATMRAQYEGYRSIAGVAPQSQTETYCKVWITLESPGWQGVNVVLEAGKRLPDVSKEVVLTLKDKSTVTIAERPNKVGEYEKLIHAALQGDHTLFPSMRAVRAQWRFIDPISTAWATGNPVLTGYPPDTMPKGI